MLAKDIDVSKISKADLEKFIREILLKMLTEMKLTHPIKSTNTYNTKVLDDPDDNI